GLYHAASGEHRRATGEIQAFPTGSAKTPRTNLRPAWLIFGVLAAALTVALGTVVFLWWRSNSAEVPPHNSLAVLPLINESDDKNAEFLSVGLADNIIANLSPLRPKLRVLASSSVSAYKGKPVTPRQIGRELNVRAVLVGRISQQGDLLVIHVELADTADGSLMWSEQYRRQRADLMAIQEDISRQISEKLQLNLTGEERKLLAKRYTSNTEAYSQYLTGRYFWNQRSDESYEKAIEFYQKAIALDPNYALAYVGIADAYVLLYDGGAQSDEKRHKAEQLARQALTIDSQLAEAHATLGFTEMFSNQNWGEAERNFKRAIELNNGYATAHHWYAILLAIHGRHEAALDEIRRAREIEPRSFPINSDTGQLLFWARRYDEAIAQYRRANESEPTNSSVRTNHFWIRNIYEAKGDVAGAIKEMRLLDPPTTGLAEFEQAFAQGGKSAYLQKRLEINARAKDVDSATGRMRLVYANAAVGNIEQAMTLLERSIAEDHSDGLMYLKVDPRFDNLRSHPRFPDALRRMKLLN
ncbi:MAG: tetratricopeptide repeat protein, partial [Acidobacteriota bacterium]|nr:tetratricopeptide repeat protein [Acidobacteriota bacterium]